jgi:hypothetical protein
VTLKKNQKKRKIPPSISFRRPSPGIFLAPPPLDSSKSRRYLQASSSPQRRGSLQLARFSHGELAGDAPAPAAPPCFFCPGQRSSLSPHLHGRSSLIPSSRRLLPAVLASSLHSAWPRGSLELAPGSDFLPQPRSLPVRLCSGVRSSSPWCRRPQARALLSLLSLTRVCSSSPRRRAPLRACPQPLLCSSMAACSSGTRSSSLLPFWSRPGPCSDGARTTLLPIFSAPSSAAVRLFL